MKMHNPIVKRQTGFSLVDAMVALAVLAFGLLAVAQFQSQLVSGSSFNKARSEALMYAQEKLDELRNYATEQELVALLNNAAENAASTFPDSIVSGTYPATPEAIEGSNAEFARVWSVDTCASSICNIAVTVTWMDPKDGEQSVALNTVVTWKNPKAAVEIGETANAELVPNATGRASLGEGKYLDSDGNVRIPEGAADNSDGTYTYLNADDRELINAATGDVVLTLKEACQLSADGTRLCTDFVTISGKAYIDGPTGSPVVTVADTYVLASDAAYCAKVTTDTDGTQLTTAGGLNYFEYTCYLGGGWHGNIGLLFTGHTNTGVTACVGDLDSITEEEVAADDTLAALYSSQYWQRVKEATRRVYRGMTYRYNADGTPVREDPSDDTSKIVYYSIGIADAVVLPDPDWVERDRSHDFFITSFSGHDDCLSKMEAARSAAGENYELFSKNPNDFICLNTDNDDSGYTYIDIANVDTSAYTADDYCPFDPSDPPPYHFQISGTILTPDGIWWSGQSLANATIETSDGSGNCTLTPTTLGAYGYTSADYICTVYAWEDNRGNITPWDGSVYLFPPAGLTCGVTTHSYDAVSSHLARADEDFTCQAEAYHYIYVYYDSADGSSVRDVTVDSSEGACNRSSSSDSTGTWFCRVFVDPNLDTWEGWIRVNGNGLECGRYGFTQPAYWSLTRDVATQFYPYSGSYGSSLDRAQCKEPGAASTVGPVTISGIILANSPAYLQAVDITDNITGNTWSCGPADMPNSATYDCKENGILPAEEWSYTVTYTAKSGSVICTGLQNGVNSIAVRYPSSGTLTGPLDITGRTIVVEGNKRSCTQ